MLSSTTKACFNSNCKEVSEKWRTGWRRRTGEYAHLCDRCAAVYEDGKYCETFHTRAPGWRCCESCGKQIHCGCIVSFHMFVLLDAGGIECLSCARKSYILTPNPAWPPPLHFLPSQPERMKDLSVKPWSSIAGSGPVPWRQAPSLFNGSVSQSNVPQRLPFEINVLGCVRDRLSTTSPQRKTEHSYEKFVNGDLRLGPSEAFHQNGNTGFHVKEQQPYYPFVNDIKPLFPKIDSSHSNLNLAMSSSSNIEADDAHHASMISEPEAMSIFMGKQHCCHNGMSSRNGPQICSGKPRGDGRGRKQLLPRYHPQISEEMFQLIPRDSKSVITPLFEKMLSASDCGRIGRLVVPKKCAEAYFPQISQPEGLPLKVQDVNGKEWVFQFRFWPNNNSRMYVLEGITPCIQSMHLQAGDVVTFSRVDPEGKLVMGCRKVSVDFSSDQVDRVNYSLEQGSDASNIRDVTATNKTGDAITNTIVGSDASNIRDVTATNKTGDAITNTIVVGSDALNLQDGTAMNKPGDVITSTVVGSDALNLCDVSSTNKLVDVIAVNDHTKDVEIMPKDEPIIQSKRKISSLGARNKRLRIVNDDATQLNLTWREAQGLMRPPAKIVPSIFVVEGCEFEEFEGAAPVIGRPTIPGTDHFIAKIQWVQCEDCFKWRKVPADVLLSSRWTCSENVWDLDRSRCSSAEQLTKEQLEHILPTTKIASSSKTPEITEEVDADLFVALEGLDKLANLAINEENENEEGPPAFSSDNTSKHPRHKSGCVCIVCLQPQSGKGSKHNQSCECVVCSSLKRRLRTLTDRRERKQSERDTETSVSPTELPFQVQDLDEPNTSPKKGQIDLNIQPEGEEDQLSPGSGAGGPMSFAQRCFRRMLGR